jgi:hypothetical protein
VLCTTGCPLSGNQVAANANQGGTQDQPADPASANLAPVGADSSAPAPAAYTPQQNPPPDTGGNDSQAYNQAPVDPGYGEQPVAYSDQAPPQLPDYDQPPAPGDDYLWTPGYWAWSPGGYYWVPGVWVQAPYEGALWTPGYWGFWNNRYQFYGGYWGPYIGFYGGVDYGFGYGGFGYQGGYWGGGHFNYNRAVNNVNGGMVHNVYDRSVGGGYRGGGGRVSFNGGSGGVQVRARPAELAGQRAPHAGPMSEQVQNARAASSNRAQFANVNHGRPASLAVSRPLAADRNMRAPAMLQQRNQSAPQQQQQRQAAPQQRQAFPQQQQRQAAPQQRQAYQQQQQQREAAPQQQQRQAAPQQRQAFQQQQQQRQIAPQQQHRQAAPQQQERQSAPQQQRQAAPQQQQRQEAHPRN